MTMMRQSEILMRGENLTRNDNSERQREGIEMQIIQFNSQNSKHDILSF